MGEKSETKYAAGVLEFAQVFEQLGRSGYGLILLEIGWLVTLTLLKGLLPEENTTLPVPLPALPFHFAIQRIELINVALVGAAAVLLLWAAYAYFGTTVRASVGQY